MKGIKIFLILLSYFFVAGMHVNAANITWGDYNFLYQVGANGANLYVQPDFSTPTPVIGPTPEFAKEFGSNGDPITSSADSTVSSDSGLNLVLKAGASGAHLTNGIKQTAYLTNSSGQNDGILNPYGVEPDGTLTQQVTAFSVRRFVVDGPGAFNLKGLLSGGIIDADDLFVPPPPIPTIVDYNYSGNVTLFENILDSSGTVTSVSQIAFIDLDDLLVAGAGVPVTQVVNLRTQVGGDAVNYDLKTQISLDSTIVNFSSFVEVWSEIPEGSLGFMGTKASPLEIEATLSEVPNPIDCKGDFDNDNDVDGTNLVVFAADFGRTNCGSAPPCEGDFEPDGDVDFSDLTTFAADFGRPNCPRP
jgi:hypothetical protein